MEDRDVVITSAFRTAIGSFNGSLSSKTGPELGSTVIKNVLNILNLNQKKLTRPTWVKF